MFYFLISPPQEKQLESPSSWHFLSAFIFIIFFQTLQFYFTIEFPCFFFFFLNILQKCCSLIFRLWSAKIKFERISFSSSSSFVISFKFVFPLIELRCFGISVSFENDTHRSNSFAFSNLSYVAAILGRSDLRFLIIVNHSSIFYRPRESCHEFVHLDEFVRFISANSHLVAQRFVFYHVNCESESVRKTFCCRYDRTLVAIRRIIWER